MAREKMEFDLVIVGAGPAGLAAAIRFKQLCQQFQKDYTVCVLEKGSEVGAHILSGAVMEPRALSELIPNWRELEAPLLMPAQRDKFYFLTESYAIPLPTPGSLKNEGNFIVSLSQVTRWLAQQAEAMGVDIFPGFAARELLYDDNNQVVGVATGDVGIARDGSHKATYQPGIELYGKQTLLAEGCRGSLSEQLIHRFNLRKASEPQSYGLGIKEIWRVDPKFHNPGTVIHTVGWPLDQTTYGGSFLYHLPDNKIAVGLVVGLDYQNPYLNPFEEMQRFKTHPQFRDMFESGERLYYGARALNEGGYYAIPKLTAPGALLIGCSAGFLNVAKIKGSHTAMKSGMLAAESVFEHLGNPVNHEVWSYEQRLRASWVAEELFTVRNIRSSFNKGLWFGLAYSALELFILKGRGNWQFKHGTDYDKLKHARLCKPIAYPKPDGKITFDRLSSVYLTGTQHQEDQPCHLQLKNPEKAIAINYEIFQSPEQRYCPAGVYEIVEIGPRAHKLQINAQNCIHCKTCDIKDMTQNIVWVPPEGGGGPNYTEM